MAYDERTATRIRSVMADRPGYSERKMFGGVCFMIHGHMCCGVVGSDLMLRLGNEMSAEALEENHTRPMDFTGKTMSSMIYVEPEGFTTESELRRWIARAVGFVETLPPKKS